MSLELTFIRNGNAPSGNTFNLKLSSNSIIKNLILESQNNIFPSDLNVDFEDFIGNKVTLKARLVRTMGNIQEWELDAVLTNDVKVKIPETEASIINVTPVLTDIKPYYAQDDIDTRISKNDLEIIQNTNNEVILNLKESRIIDRVKLLKNISDLEIFYTPGEGQDWIPLTNIEIDNTLKIHPIMAKSICLRSSTKIEISEDEFEIFMFNYLSVEIENLFTDNTYTALKPEVTMESVEKLLDRTTVTSEYLEKLFIAKNILLEKIMPITISYESENFKVFEKFEIKSTDPIYRVIINYEDSYGNRKSLQSDDILDGIVTFEKFYSKNIDFNIYGVEASSTIEISEIELHQDDYYLQSDMDSRVDKNTIIATSGCGTYAHLIAQRAVDGDESTNFHSESYTSIGHGDVYFNFSNPVVMDRIHILTRANSLGRIDNYKVLYKERSNEGWIEIAESVNEGVSGNWRNVKINPILVSDICIRVTKSNDDHVIIYETEFFKHNTLEKKLKDLFQDAECEVLREGVSIAELDLIERLLGTTQEYIELFNKAKSLYIDSLLPVKYSVNLATRSVISSLRFNSVGRVLKCLVKWIDEYGYEKTSEEISKVEDKQILAFTFEKFYASEFELNIFGEVTLDDISNVEVLSISQDDYYASEDIDVRLDKGIMTAKSLCGQYSNESPAKAIDGDENTNYHSADYTQYGTGEYGDFQLELGDLFVIDRVNLKTRSSHNGRIKAYEVLYKTKSEENWKKVFEQLTEESGVNREAKFKPVLASEICIRVTNGHNNFIYISEMDVFKFNLIEERISNLFLDENETILRENVTLEEIEDLEKILITEEYIKRVQKAKTLYIDGLLPEIFEIDLLNKTIFDKVEFLCEERILKAEIEYEDVLGNTLVARAEIKRDDARVSLEIPKIMTSKAQILIYGAERIYSVETNMYSTKEFAINEDINTKFDLANAILTPTTENTSYPLINLYDGNLENQFHSTPYNDYFELKIKLEKEYLIDSLRLLSFRSNTSGLINRFKVLVKTADLNNPWLEFGSKTVEGYKNEWLETKNTPYLTDEVCLRVEDSVNKWVLMNELELFIYNTLNDDIKDLFEDSEETILRESIQFEDILALEERCLVTESYKIRVQKAKDLYLERLNPVVANLKNDKISIFKSIDVLLDEELDYLYCIKLKYETTSKAVAEIKDIVIQKQSNSLKIEFSEVVGKNIEVSIYLDEYEKYKINSIQKGSLDQSLYYNLNDIYRYYPIENISVESKCGETISIQNMLDGDINTYFQSNGLGDIIFIFDEKKVIDEFKYYCRHGNGNNGKINRAKLLYKENSDSEWKVLVDYNTSSPFSGENVFAFNPTLVKEVCFRIEEAYAGIVVLNHVSFKVYNRLEDEINNLFEDKVMLRTLKKNITLKVVENLKAKVIQDKELRVKLYIAEVILKNKRVSPFKSYKIKSIKNSIQDYFNPLKTNTTGDLCLTPYYLHSNKDYVFVANKSIDAHIVIRENGPRSEFSFRVQKGLNIINMGDQTGQMVVTGSRVEEIEVYSLDKEDALIYRYGYTSEDELYDKPQNEVKVEEITDEDENVTVYNSNLAYVEGRNFIGVVRYDWILKNIPKGKLTKMVELADEFIDFLYYLDNKDEHFNNSIPYKRLMWVGSRHSNPHAGGGLGGGYTAYSGGSHDVLNSSLTRFANSWVVGHEIGHEMDVNNYHMNLFGEVTNNWYAEECMAEFTKGIRTANNMIDISDKNDPINKMGVFDVLAFWFKFRAYYGDNDFIVKMHQYMQKISTESIEDTGSKLAVYVTRILKRDASDYFLKHGFELTAESIEYCNTYPKFTIDISGINWSNQDEFRAEEKRLFNLRYKGN
ncbi:MAG: discoidin domain-containing protein [Cetobacterium sp.]|uniref:discoidin domain-containing protein n=1 Tax=Cetobacterium sp. TaxID=2071632 RepID=UPI003F33EF82